MNDVCELNKPFIPTSLRLFLSEHNIKADVFNLNSSCHTVAQAAIAVGCREQDLVKNICMVDPDGQLIIAIVNGVDRVDPAKVRSLLHINGLRMASAEDVLRKTGFPAGGVPSFGYAATFVVDENAASLEEVYTGGGSAFSLIKIRMADVLRLNHAIVADIRQ